MQLELLKAFQVLDSQATMECVREACKQLFLHSDEYQLAGENPFNASEVEVVSNAIYEYITSANDPVCREIVFDVARKLEGKSIEYDEYASMFSEDMLFESRPRELKSCSLEELRCALKVFLVGILFRYRFCDNSGKALFPVSIILDYNDAIRVLLSREQRDHEWPEALLTTLSALRSLEWTYRISLS